MTCPNCDRFRDIENELREIWRFLREDNNRLDKLEDIKSTNSAPKRYCYKHGVVRQLTSEGFCMDCGKIIEESISLANSAPANGKNVPMGQLAKELDKAGVFDKSENIAQLNKKEFDKDYQK